MKTIERIHRLRPRLARWAMPSAAYATMLSALMAASGASRADDIDIYTRAIDLGISGTPVLMFQVDNSGSMLWSMSSSSTASDVIDQRLYRLVDIAMAQFTGGKGNFKFGISSYTAGTNSGVLRLPAYELQTTYAAVAGTSTFDVSDENDDAYQDYSSATPTRYGEELRMGTTIAAQTSTITVPYSNATYARWPMTYPAASVTAMAEYGLTPATGSAGTASGVMVGIRGNVVFHYTHGGTTNDQVFKVTSATADSYLAVTDANGVVLESTNTTDGSSGCSSVTGNNTCLTINLTKSTSYRVVVGTGAANATGTFTFELGYSSRAASNGVKIESRPPLPRRVGLSFDRVNVPQGATITNAYIEFKPNTGRGNGAVWRAGVDTSLTPADFKTTLFGTSRTVNWMAPVALGSWSTDTVNSNTRLTVTSLLQAKVDQSGWCGGDVVALVDALPNTSDAIPERAAYAYERHWRSQSAMRPRLVVQWSGGSLPSSCKNRTVEVKVENSSDDVQQNTDGSINFDTKSGSSTYTRTLAVSASKSAGLRFPLIPLPTGSEVSDARLWIVPASGSVQPLKIKVVLPASGNMSAFEGEVNALDALAVVGEISWTPASWTAGTPIQSPDLSGLIDLIVSSDTWSYDNAIGVVIEGAGSSESSFRAWEYKDTSSNTTDRARYGVDAARLVITAQHDDPIPVLQTHRWRGVQELNRFEGVTNTPIMGAYIETARYLMGWGTYAGKMPPLSEGECATNGIVVLTDGEETGSYSSTHRTNAQAISGKTCSTSDSTNTWKCTYDMVAAMYNKRNTHEDGKKYSVRTDAIGFGPEAGSLAGLGGIEGKGGGKVFFASDSAALSKAFRDIISTMSISTASVAASGVAVNALNRFEHMDQLYYALFAPSSTVDWTGNLKRYRLNDSKIKDAMGEEAVDTVETGFFKAESRSYWSNLVDGSNVSVGGAAGEIPATSRQVYTYLPTTAPSNSAITDQVVSGNAGLTYDVLGLPAMTGWSSLTTTQKNAKRAAVIDWLRASPYTDTTYRWGAAVHNSPRVVTYDATYTSDPRITVFYGDNRGAIHAVASGQFSDDNSTVNLANTGGEELWAFMPKDLLANAGKLYENTQQVADGYIYGIDGDMSVYREPQVGTPSKVYLFAGMRRGGKDYFALDVTNSHRGVTPAVSRLPKFKWMLKGGSAGVEEMGQSWSGMIKAQLRYNGVLKRVLAIGGGYDPSKHDTPYGDFAGKTTFDSSLQLGRALILLDMESGAVLLNTAKLSTATYPALADMRYSVTASPVMFDRNADGFTDAAYVVDLAGQVFRFEFNPNATGASNLLSKVVLVAKLGGTASGANPVTDNRRFLEPPSVARLGEDMVIAVSSGYREEARSTSAKEGFFFLRDIGAYKRGDTSNATLTVSQLDNLSDTPDETTADVSKPGWFFYFQQSTAEKGIGSPLIFDYGILFAAWNSSNADLECTPDVGSTNLYFVGFNGAGLIPGNDRSMDIGLPGFGDTPQVIMSRDKLDVLVGPRAIDGDDLGMDDLGKQGWNRARWMIINR